MRLTAIGSADFVVPSRKNNNINNKNHAQYPSLNYQNHQQEVYFSGFKLKDIFKNRTKNNEIKERCRIQENADDLLQNARHSVSQTIGIIEFDISNGFSNSKKTQRCYHTYRNNDPMGRKFITIHTPSKVKEADFDPWSLRIYSIEETDKKSKRTNKCYIAADDRPTEILTNYKIDKKEGTLNADEVFVFDNEELKEYYKKAVLLDTGEVIKHKKHYSFN